MKYDRLEMQEYLLEGNRNTRISKLIFKARGRNLEIKTHKNGNIVMICVLGVDKMLKQKRNF